MQQLKKIIPANKKISGLYNELMEKRDSKNTKLKNMITMLNTIQPTNFKENSNAAFDLKLKTSTLFKENKIESRNGTLNPQGGDTKSKSKIGNLL